MKNGILTMFIHKGSLRSTVGARTSSGAAVAGAEGHFDSPLGHSFSHICEVGHLPTRPIWVTRFRAFLAFLA